MPEEKEKWKRVGACLRCGYLGHMAKECFSKKKFAAGLSHRRQTPLKQEQVRKKPRVQSPSKRSAAVVKEQAEEQTSDEDYLSVQIY